jgi:hypothetical protein
MLSDIDAAYVAIALALSVKMKKNSLLDQRMVQTEDHSVSFPVAQQHLVGQGLLIIEASRSHSDTPHSVGLL